MNITKFAQEQGGLFTFVVATTLMLLLASVTFAWTSPNQAPPDGNVPAPINVGTAAQVKNGALSVNRFMVNEHMMVVGPVGATQRFLNFNSTLGFSGYGFRDRDGVMEYKNAGQDWRPIQSSRRHIREATAESWWMGGNGLYYSSAVATCDPGYVATGGGGYCDGNAGSPVQLFSSRPAGANNNWEATCHQSDNVITYPGGRGATAYVICIQQ